MTTIHSIASLGSSLALALDGMTDDLDDLDDRAELDSSNL